MQDAQTQNKTTVRRLFLIVASITICALGFFMLGESENLSAEEAQTSSSSAKAASGGKVLATVNGAPITEGEAAASVAGEMLKVERQRHDLLSRAVRTEVENRLVEAAAKAKGMSREDLLKQEVEGKTAEVTAEAIDAFYEQRKAQIRQPKEQVASQIQRYLEQQNGQDAYKNYIAELEKGAKVEYMIEPFRVDVSMTGPSKGGDKNAPIQIVEFSDFECPFCGRVNPTLKQVQDTYGDKVRITFRQFPLAIHPNARKAGEASLCADDQGKFWEMHDAMFADQRNLGVDSLKKMAAALDGLDTGEFDTCLDSGKYSDTVETDFQEGSQAGVSGTPAFFINGRFLNGAVPYEQFSEIIDEELGR